MKFTIVCSRTYFNIFYKAMLMIERKKLIDSLRENLRENLYNNDDIPLQVLNKLKINIDVWVKREDVCIGCHSDNCDNCIYKDFFKK